MVFHDESHGQDPHSARGRPIKRARHSLTENVTIKVQSTTSYDSTASLTSDNTTYSAKNAGTTSNLVTTPMTSSDASPPKSTPRPTAPTPEPLHQKLLSPPPSEVDSTSVTRNDDAKVSSARRTQAIPSNGKIKGYRTVWDPELDSKLSSHDKKKSKPKLKSFGIDSNNVEPPPDPRLAIAGYSSGNCVSKTAVSKSKLRIAPYVIKPYVFDTKNSVGPGAPKQVVVTGFDPFTSESHIRSFFSTYGSVALVQHQTNPDTGSFLGICLVKYKDTKPLQGPAVSATQSAKRAELEGNGERMGSTAIRVQRDREGRKCQRMVEHALQRAKAKLDLAKLKVKALPTGPALVSSRSATWSKQSATVADVPANTPIGPSNMQAKGRPTTVEPSSASSPHFMADLAKRRPLLESIRRKPYIVISPHSVPLNRNIVYKLERRLKNFDFDEIRVDITGHFVIFEDSVDGEREALKCYKVMNKQCIFDYTMDMECFHRGNPNYTEQNLRSKVDVAVTQEPDHIQVEIDVDLEAEKKQRAENLDPVRGALEMLSIDLRKRIMDEVKSRVVMPLLHERLDPALHVSKRRKLGLLDARGSEDPVIASRLHKSIVTPPGTPKSRSGRSHAHSKPLRPHDTYAGRSQATSTDAFVDERRRQPRKNPHAHTRPLNFRLQDMFQAQDDNDSDEEGKTPASRDNDDGESRARSSASRTATPIVPDEPDTPFDDKVKDEDDEPAWDPDQGMDRFESLHKQLLGNLLSKNAQDMALGELELVINTLPESFKFQERARQELYYRQRTRRDDELFDVQKDASTTLVADIAMQRDDYAQESIQSKTKAIKPKAKKKKTKKELAAEAALLTEDAELPDHLVDADTEFLSPLDTTMLESPHEESKVEINVKDEEEEKTEVATHVEVEWAVSTDEPRRTVEDNPEIVLDVEGWQNMVKDAEDLKLLAQVLLSKPKADLGDAQLWARKQKLIKTLNAGNETVGRHLAVPGYYVPNASGSARTEGVKKILESAKSKYLPHRIRVQTAREARQALAKTDSAAPAEVAKQFAAAKIASTSSSRSDRVNNRRLVNDINIQKQNVPANGTEADAFRFNQLIKRKKHVKFDRSAIHGWGLYTEENIAANDFIIEYVGEKIRQKVADLREIRYDKQGVGSNYLFRMADDEIIDATKRGGIARFVNHSCMPNCTAKIIKVEGTRRIVIYALKDIGKSEELTYDYKFEREIDDENRVPCLCGTVGCKGFLN